MIKKVFPVLALCVFSSTLGMGIVSPLLPIYAQKMGANGIWLGIIVAAYSISYGFLTPIAGRLSDRRGRKIFLAVGLLGYSIISLGYIWASNVALLALVRLVQGVAAATTLPIATAYVGDLSPEGEEGKWMGYANAAFFSGFGLGPLIGGTLTENFSMAVPFLTMGGLNLIAFFITIFSLPEVSTHKKRMAGASPSFKEISRSGVIKGLFSFRLTEAIGRGGNMVFLPLFASALGLSITLVGMLLTVSILSVTILSPFGGRLADRLNKRGLVVVGEIVFIVSMILIPLSNNFGQLLTALFVMGISGAICMPAASAWVVEEGRKFGMGATLSVFFMAMGIGTAIGPILSGVVADIADVNSVFYMAAGMGIIGTGLLVWFTRKRLTP
ncbi:MAG: MFS transporter [Chloroflexota bacterium]